MQDNNKFARTYARKMKNFSQSGVIKAATTVRNEYTWADYEDRRQSQRTPKTVREIMAKSEDAYNKIVMVRNAMDLISDLACDGIRIQHPSKRIQKLYDAWWEKVKGTERSKMLVLLLYLHANVLVNRSTAVVNDAFMRNLMNNQDYIQSSVGLGNFDDKFAPKTVKKNEIPWKYTFLNPQTVEIVGEDLAPFLGKFIYKLSLPGRLAEKFKTKDPELLSLLSTVDEKFIEEAKKGRISLDSDRLRVFHYRKKDWEPWARPMLEAIMDDLILFSGLRMADQAACDSACSQVNMWLLGDMDKGILPSESEVMSFLNLIKTNTGGGTKDVAWGPALKLIQTQTNLDKFLGEDKYVVTIRNIRLGLGLPSVFIDDGGSMTNAFMSVQVLLKRMTYAREVLLEFWNEELALMQAAFGHQKPAKIVFDGIDFSDPNAEKQIWIALFDRNIVSTEDFREKLGLAHEVTSARVWDEYEQEGKTMRHKAGPYYDAQPELTLEKIRLQKKQPNAPAKTTENPGPGRPDGAKDGKTRKQRTPRSQANFVDNLFDMMTAYNIAEDIIVTAAPQVTDEDLEKFVFAALLNFPLPIEESVKESLKHAKDNFGVVNSVRVKISGKDAICTYCALEKNNG